MSRADAFRGLNGTSWGQDGQHVDLDTQARLAAACLPHPRAARAVVRLGRADSHPARARTGGWCVAPADYQQGDGFRILYVHAPAAWMSLFIYVVMALAAAVGLIWRIKLAHAAAAACAPVGASFTFLALATGSIWGKPMWGTWWVWDARLTSELILLFLYLGYMALRVVVRRPRPRGSRERGAGDRRRDQRPDHPLLGGVVDHAASARERDAAREAFDRAANARATVHHAGRIPALFRLAAVLGACRARSCGASATPAGSRRSAEPWTSVNSWRWAAMRATSGRPGACRRRCSSGTPGRRAASAP